MRVAMGIVCLVAMACGAKDKGGSTMPVPTPTASSARMYVPEAVATTDFWLKLDALCRSPAATNFPTEAKAPKTVTDFLAWCRDGGAWAVAEHQRTGAFLDEIQRGLTACALQHRLTLAPEQVPLEMDTSVAEARVACAKPDGTLTPVAVRDLLVVSQCPIPAAKTRAKLDDCRTRFKSVHALDSDIEKRGAVDTVVTSSTAGGSPLTLTADMAFRAIASLLEKRAKAEIRAFVLKRLRDEVCKDGVKAWLPATCAFIGTAADDSSLPITIGASLRSALVLDALGLPKRVVAILLMKGDRDELVLRLAVESSLILVDRGDVGQVGRLLEHLGSADGFACEGADCTTLQGHFATVGKLVTTIYQQRLHELPDLVSAAKRVAGILQASYKITVDETKVVRLLTSIKAAVEAARVLDAKLDAALSEEARDRERVARVIAFVRAAIAVIHDAMDAAKLDRELIARVTTGLEAVTNIVEALVTANIARVVTTTASLVTIKADSLPPAVVRATAFAAELATASSAAEVEAAIDAVAAPVGAWQQKLKRFVFAVNAYVGATASRDSIEVGAKRLDGWSVGPVGSVGLDFGWAWPHKYFRLGFYTSVIDVGSLLTYSDADDDDEEAAGAEVASTTPIGFAQVFSPGLFVRFGLGDLPLTVGGGVSVIPEGRSVALDMDSADQSVVRWSIFVAVDITLLPF